MGSYRLTEDAENDLYRIWLYGLEHWGLAEAGTYTDAFFKCFEEIADNPLQYVVVDSVRSGYRRSVCGVDAIYYRIEENMVEIMSFIGRQDTGQWLK